MWSQLNIKEILHKEWRFIKLTMSYLTTVLYRTFMGFISIMFAGTISQVHLDGVGLANTLYNIVSYSFSRGYTFTFETFGPQVYGSSEPGELTTCLMKCLLQGGMLQLLILGPYLNLVYLIDILPDSALQHGDDADLSDYRRIAVKYLRITTLVEFLDYTVTLISTYFAVLGKTKYIYVISVMMVSAHLLTNYTFVSLLGLGVEGVGIAAIISRLLTLVFSVCVCIININKGEIPWKGFSTKVFIGWKPMIELGIPAAILMFVQISLLEISTFCSQFVSLATFSALIITLQCYYLMWSAAQAMSFTASNLIGDALSQGDATDVRHYMILTLTNSFIAAVPTALITYFLRGYLAGIFSEDADVIDLFSRNFWLVSAGLIIQNLMLTINHGILTAFGEQAYTSITLTISSLFVGLPFVLATSFLTAWGMIGILIGWVMNDGVLLITGLVKIWKTDISKEIEKSHLRVEKSTYGTLDTIKLNMNFEDPGLKTEEISDKTRIEQRFESPISGRDKEARKLLHVNYIRGGFPADVNEVNLQRDTKTVCKFFLLSVSLFVVLASISFIRDYN